MSDEIAGDPPSVAAATFGVASTRPRYTKPNANVSELVNSNGFNFSFHRGVGRGAGVGRELGDGVVLSR